MIIPWEKSEQAGFYTSTWGRYGHQKRTFSRTVEHLDDSSKQYWRKGDIVKFNNGRMPQTPSDISWKDWFMTEKDWLNTLPWHGQTPRYAAEQYAVIAGRYRVIKNKHITYIDYGVVIMMLTGPKKGHVRRYWQTRPFQMISKFPHINPPRVSIELIDSFMEHQFLKCLYKKLNVKEI